MYVIKRDIGIVYFNHQFIWNKVALLTTIIGITLSIGFQTNIILNIETCFSHIIIIVYILNWVYIITMILIVLNLLYEVEFANNHLDNKENLNYVLALIYFIAFSWAIDYLQKFVIGDYIEYDFFLAIALCVFLPAIMTQRIIQLNKSLIKQLDPINQLLDLSESTYTVLWTPLTTNLLLVVLSPIYGTILTKYFVLVFTK